MLLDKDLLNCTEGVGAAESLHELGAALLDPAQRLVGASSMCFLPFGRHISTTADGTLFHEQHSREHMHEELVAWFPMTEREFGVDGTPATERLFALRRGVIDLNELLAPQGLEGTRTFNEFWRPCHIERQLFAPLATGNRPLGYLCFGRTRREAQFEPSQINLAGWLSRRVVQAMERLAGEVTAHFDIMLATLRHLPLSCGLFDVSGRVLWLSSEAERVLGLRLIGATVTQLIKATTALTTWRAAVQQAVASEACTMDLNDLVLQRFDDRGTTLILVRQQRPNRPERDPIDAMRSRWRLTPRETEVLQEVAAGRCNKEIGLDLGCSTRTVEVHVSSILVKSGCSSRSELVAQLWRVA
jgi:DNA-binding NarL/FixJ family response regulator